MSTFEKLLFVIIPAVLVCFASSNVYAEIRRVYRLRVWTRATGHILSSRVTEGLGYEDTTTYNVEVEYQYEVDGFSYRGKDCLMAVSSQFRKHAEALCQSHPPGAEFPIVYNPKQADDSEIADPSGFRGGAILFLIFALVLAFFGIRTVLEN